MGISNTIPPSRLIQPGVVADTAARPTSPFTGQAIYQVDTNQYLIWNGTAWVIPNTPAQNPTGLELVTTATCSSGGTASGGVITIGSAVSSVVITNAFSSTYDNYKIVVGGGTPSANANMRMVLGSSVTGYYAARNGMIWSTGLRSDGVDNNAAIWAAVGTTQTNGMAAEITVINPSLAKYTTIGGVYNNDTAGVVYAGTHQVATAFTGFTLSPSSGTITGGTIRIYGYRN